MSILASIIAATEKYDQFVEEQVRAARNDEKTPARDTGKPLAENPPERRNRHARQPD